MNRLTWIVLLVVTLGLGVALLRQRQAVNELRVVINEGRASVADLTALRTQNTKLRRQAAESHLDPAPLREQIRQLQDQIARYRDDALELPREDNRVFPHRNRGRATSVDAYATLLWAIETRQIDILAASLLIDPKVRDELQKLFASLPTHHRDAFQTPERMLATVLIAPPSDGLLTHLSTGTAEIRHSRFDGKIMHMKAANGAWWLHIRPADLPDLRANIQGWQECFPPAQEDSAAR